MCFSSVLVSDTLGSFEEDFLVDNHVQPAENIEQYYFSRAELRDMDPDFVFPGYVFNGGVVVATSGLLTRSRFRALPWTLALTLPARLNCDIETSFAMANRAS